MWWPLENVVNWWGRGRSVKWYQGWHKNALSFGGAGLFFRSHPSRFPQDSDIPALVRMRLFFLACCRMLHFKTSIWLSIRIVWQGQSSQNTIVVISFPKPATFSCNHLSKSCSLYGALSLRCGSTHPIARQFFRDSPCNMPKSQCTTWVAVQNTWWSMVRNQLWWWKCLFQEDFPNSPMFMLPFKRDNEKQQKKNTAQLISGSMTGHYYPTSKQSTCWCFSPFQEICFPKSFCSPKNSFSILNDLPLKPPPLVAAKNRGRVVPSAVRKRWMPHFRKLGLTEAMIFKCSNDSFWRSMNGETYNYVQLVVEPPIWKICASQNWIISPGIRVKIKNLWNHHLDVVYHLPVFMATGSSDPKNHPGGSRCKYQANHRAMIQQAYMSSVHMSSFNIILFSTSNQDSTHTHVSTLHHTNVYIFTYFYIIYSICHFQNEHHDLWLNGGHWLGTSPLIPPQHRVQKTHFPVAFFPKSSAWRHGIHGEKTTVAMWISTNPIIPITQHRLPDGHFCLLPIGNFAEVGMQRCHFTKGSNEISDLEAWRSQPSTHEQWSLHPGRHDSGQRPHSHMHPPAGHFRPLQLQIVSLRQSPTD